MLKISKLGYLVIFITLLTLLVSVFGVATNVESSSLINKIEKNFNNKYILYVSNIGSVEKKIELYEKDSSKIEVEFDNSIFYYNFDDNDVMNNSEDVVIDDEYSNFISLDGDFVDYDTRVSREKFLPNLSNLYFENPMIAEFDIATNSIENDSSLLSELVETRNEMIAKLNTEDFEDEYEAAKKGKIDNYIVKNGETLLSISKKLDISYGTLKKLNKVDSPFVASGKTITVPKLKKNKKASNKKLIQMYVKKKKNKGGLKWPVVAKRISSRYGYRIHPISRRKKFHNGIDLAASYGKKIIAAASGKVEFSGWKSYYGKTVIIVHPGGYKTLYAHCSKLYVKKGQKVGTGTKIAAIGQTGLSTGPHLHFSVIKRGKYQNPLSYLK